MITLIHAKSADYLKFDEPVNIEPKTLLIANGLELVPGMKVTRLGTKARTSFILKDGLYMEYEGIYTHPSNGSHRIRDYAIFNCPSFDISGEKVKYRYAFSIAKENGLCFAFIVGPGGPEGCWDVRLDSIELFDEKQSEIINK